MPVLMVMHVHENDCETIGAGDAFIGALAFSDARLIEETKIGVLAGSLISALLGLLILRTAKAHAD